MADRYDAVSVREYTDRTGDKRTSFTRIGVAFRSTKGDGFTVLLDAVPASVDGQYKIVLLPPKEREQRPSEGHGRGETRSADELDDDIRF